MGKYQIANFFILLVNLGTLLSSLACDCSNNPPPPPSTNPSNCPPPTYSPSPKTPPPPPLLMKSPPPPPPIVKSPPPPPPVVKSPPPPLVVKPPTPYAPNPKSPPPRTIVPTPPPPKQRTCPMDALKLDACVDVLGGLINTGLGDSAKEKCCPLLQGLADFGCCNMFLQCH